MARQPIADALGKTIDDRRVSRGERQALRALIAEAELSDHDLAWLRSRAFALAEDELGGRDARQVLGWLKDVVGLLVPEPRRQASAEALFSPGDDCVGRLAGLLDAVGRSLDVCVFTITDDRVSRAVLGAHRRGVRVRIVSDDMKSLDRGSDLERMSAAGIPVAVDDSPDHMHHKFAILDGVRLVNGSYNWTRSAADGNSENLVITDDPRLVRSFQGEFDRFWRQYRP